MSAPQAGNPEQVPRPQRNIAATAGMVCGILQWIPICIVPFFSPILILTASALALGLIGYVKARDPRVGGKSTAIKSIALGVAGFVLLSIIIPSPNRAQETANRVQCAFKLRQIGQACLLYIQSNNGAYPPDFGTLIRNEDITADTFICPDVDLVPPSNMTKDQASIWVNQNSSYFYTGAGLTQDCDPSIIVVYEKDSNHGTGMNLLFADGHVEFDNLAEAHEAIEKGKLKRK
jgi:prepilin-type processing-associated H-X9-DG protein